MGQRARKRAGPSFSSAAKACRARPARRSPQAQPARRSLHTRRSPQARRARCAQHARQVPQARSPAAPRTPAAPRRPGQPAAPRRPGRPLLPASPVGRAGSEKHQRASLRHRRSIFCLKRSIWCFFEFSSLILHRCDQALWRFLFQICNLRREKKHQTSRMRHDFESRCRRRSVRCPWAGLFPSRCALLCPYLPAWSTLLPRTWFAAA